MESTLKEEILDKFLQLSESISIIEDRCKNIQNVDDFLLSPWGMTVLDACIMRIQVIGETIKAIDDKTQRSFFKDYPQVPWAKVIGLRNIISHEYGNVDSEQIFIIIKKYLPELILCTVNIVKDVQEGKHDLLFHEK